MEVQPLPTRNQHKMQLGRMETRHICFFWSLSMHENGIPWNYGTRTWAFMVIVAKETAEISYQESIFLPFSPLSPILGLLIAVRLVTHPDRFSRDAVDSPCMEITKSHLDTVFPAWPCSGRVLAQIIFTGLCQPQPFPNSATPNPELKFWSRSIPTVQIPNLIYLGQLLECSSSFPVKDAAVHKLVMN